MRSNRRTKANDCPWLEILEDRVALSLAIQIDYSLDSSGFFSDPARRQLLQTAADTLGSRLNDSLLEINPGGSNTWSANFDNPSTGLPISLPNLKIPANTVEVFAGARVLNGAEVGNGEFGGYDASGSNAWLDLVAARGQLGALSPTPTDFGPWGGAISFDTDTFNNPASGYFGTDPSKLQNTQNDFLSVAFHELEHLLGFGTAPSWMDQVTKVAGIPTSFAGPISNALYDKTGPLPVSPDGGHWASLLQDGGVEASMTPSLIQGTRKLPTRLDYAGLQDLGWSVTSDADGTIAGATDSTLHGLGMQMLHGLAIGPDVSDVDLFKLSGSAGQILTAATTGRSGGATVDTFLRLFNASGQEIKHINNGVYDTLTYQLPSDGTYYIGVSGTNNVAYSVVEDFARRLGGATGDYELSLSLDPATGGVISDLGVQLTVPPLSTQGKPFSFTIGVMNHGPDPAGSTQLTAGLPGGVTVISMAVSQGVATLGSGVLNVNFGAIGPNFGAVVQVTVVAVNAGVLTFTASVSAIQSDPNPLDNQATSSTTVQSAVVIPPPESAPPTVNGVQVMTSGKKTKKVTTIVVHFDEMLDPTQVKKSPGFFLSKPGKAKPHKPIPRLALPISSVAYSAADQTIRIVTKLAGVIPKGLQLRISGSVPNGVRNLAGKLLDGDKNGSAGGDAVLTLR